MEKSDSPERLKTERFLLSLASDFISLDPEKIDQRITLTLKDITNSLQLERCYLYLINNDKSSLLLTHYYYQKGAKSKIRRHEQVDKEDFHWLMHSILNKQPVYISAPADLLTKSCTMKTIMEIEQTHSMLLWPLSHQEDVLGFIGVDSVREQRLFSVDEQYLLEMCAQIITQSLLRRKQAQSELLRERKYKNLFSEIEDVVFISTPEGKLLEINTAGVKLFGYESVQELLQLNIGRDLYINAQDRVDYKEAMRIRGHIKNHELKLKRKDGKKIIVLETATVVRNEHGEIVAYQGILHDITDRRQLEQELARSQKLESIGLLAGGIAHDFNNILTTIRGYADLILLDLDDSSLHSMQLRSIIDSSKRAEELIRNLLAFSRRQMIEPKIINLNKVINELHNMLSRLIKEDIQFELHLGKNLHNIKADPAQIQQILINLVVNANHAIKMEKNNSKKRRIKITTEERELIEESVAGQAEGASGKFLLIAVEDSGIGIEESIKEKIFEPFYTTKKDGEGTGLGLSTVYGIVKQNKGVIHIESEPGIGTIFEIFWPVSDENCVENISTDTNIQFKPTGETILLVEDDPHVRGWVSGALKSLGYKLFEAEDGERALDMVVNENLLDKIDLLISDVVMPVMSGEELAENIKKIKPSIKIILCSGYTQTRVFEGEKSHQNKYCFLSKPFSIKQLEQTIRVVLQQ
jgi:two-component system cell cycle sensor histidine kinase/response regulator CckA